MSWENYQDEMGYLKDPKFEVMRHKLGKDHSAVLGYELRRFERELMD